MQRSLYIDLFPTLRASLYNFKISSNRPPLLIIHLPSLLITYPSMGTSSTGVDPHNVLETKIISQRNIHNLDSHRNKLPTLIAYIRFVTTRPNLVIISQIDIET